MRWWLLALASLLVGARVDVFKGDTGFLEGVDPADRRTAASCRTHCRHAPREQQRDPQRLGRRTTVDTHGRLLWQRVENAALLHSLATHHACPAPQFDQRVGNYRGRSSRPNQRRAATCPPVHRRHMCL